MTKHIFSHLFPEVMAALQHIFLEATPHSLQIILQTVILGQWEKSHHRTEESVRLTRIFHSKV